MALSEAESRLFLGGSLDLSDSSLDVEAEGVASLGLLQSFYPEIATTGETTLSARITGTLDRPSILGHADFDGGSIRLEGFRQALGGLRGRVVFDNRTLRVSEIDAVFGSGPVVITGTIALEGLRPGSVDLTVILDGRAVDTRMTPETSILDAALRVRSELPFSCKGGMCATCKGRIEEGEVRMDKNYALVDSEVEAGYVLTCQAHPVTDRVVVRYDHR